MEGLHGRQFHFISTSSSSTSSGDVLHQSNAAINAEESRRLRQPGRRRTYGRLIRAAFTCGSDPRPEIKMLWAPVRVAGRAETR